MIYTYTCDKCGDFEIDKRMMDPAPKECPRCHAQDIRRIFNSYSIPPVDSTWGMKPQYIGHLGDHNDPSCYCTSRQEAVEKLKRKGFSTSQIEIT